eukprot:gene10311-5487_t
MRLMKVDDRNIQAETSRELLSMFYGLVFAYDEGLKNGDDVLAAAVWRNLFHASKAQATTQDLAVMVTLAWTSLIVNGPFGFVLARGFHPRARRSKMSKIPNLMRAGILGAGRVVTAFSNAKILPIVASFSAICFLLFFALRICASHLPPAVSSSLQSVSRFSSSASLVGIK